MQPDPSLSVEQRVHQLRELFEQQWQTGQSPKIESFLSQVEKACGLQLLRELLRIELQLRLEVGQTPLFSEYLQRFSDQENVLREVFSTAVSPPTQVGGTDTASLCVPSEETGSSIPTSTMLTRSSKSQEWRTIGRYRVDRELGRGGFGVVFLAYDAELDRHVAIKVPHAERLRTSADAEAYVAEAKLVARLDHPAIVPVFDAGRTDDGRCFVVSKYVQGVNLADELAERRPKHFETAQLVARVADAVHYAHLQGVVHRDIKPANILLDRQQRAYLTDFGLALREEDFGSGPRLTGTPAYMSPEQASGNGHCVDGRSDVFSLGIVLYELLTGLRPFQADTATQLLERIRTVDARPPRQIDDMIPAALERVCLTALARLPTARYTTAKDLADALRNLSDQGQSILSDARQLSSRPGNAGLVGERRTIHLGGELASPARKGDSNIPVLPGHYVARPLDLQTVKAKLLSNSTHRVGVHGMGGVGKTVLAAALASDAEVQQKFPDGILWVKLGQQPDLVYRQVQIARALGDSSILFADAQQGRARLSELLGERTCLIVLDDVWHETHVGVFDCVGARGRLLITTRDAGLLAAVGADECRLNPLEPSQSLALLKEWTAATELPREAVQAAAECGGLPLALAMVGAMVRGKPHRWENVLHRLRSADLEKIRQQFPDYPYPDLLKAIQASTDALPDDVRQCYLDFAVFASGVRLSEEVIARFWSARGMDLYETQDVIELLLDRCLLFRDAEERIYLHDLQTHYVRGQQNVTASTPLHRSLLDSYRRDAPDGWHQGPDDGYYFRFLPHHLSAADSQDELRELLLDFRWLRTKLQATDVSSVISDFHLAAPATDLQLVCDALRLSAHHLAREPRWLASQLSGRLGHIESGSVEGLLKSAGRQTEHPWLRPRQASLTRPGGRLVRTFEGHTRGVRAAAISRQAGLLVSGSADCTIRIWDLGRGVQRHCLEGHGSSVDDVAVTTDGRRAVSAGLDRTLKVWDLERGSLLHTMTGHRSWVRAVLVMPDQRHAVSASSDTTLRVWDLEEGRAIRVIEMGLRSRSMTLASDGRRLFSAYRDIRVTDLESGQTTPAMEGHAMVVNCLALTADDRYLLSGSDDNNIKVWDALSGEMLGTLKGHRGPVQALAPAADHDRVLSASDDGTIRVWQLSTLRQQDCWQAHSAGIRRLVAIGDDACISGAHDGRLKMWKLISQSAEQQPASSFRGDEIRSVMVTSDGARAVSTSADGTLTIWEPETGDRLRTLAAHVTGIRSLAAMHRKPCILTGDSSGLIRIWDPFNNCLVSGLDAHRGAVQALAVMPDDRRIVSGGQDRLIRVWDVESLQLEATLKGHSGEVSSISFSRDGQRAVSAAVDDHNVCVWDLERGKLFARLECPHSGVALAVGLTSDGRYAVAGCADGVCRVWDLNSGLLEATFTGHSAGVQRLALTPDDREAVTGAADGSVHVWDLTTGHSRAGLLGHREGVTVLAVSPDGKWLASGAYDGVLQIWDAATGQPVAGFACDAAVVSGAFCLNVSTIVVGDAIGGTHFLNLENSSRTVGTSARIVNESSHAGVVATSNLVKPMPKSPESRSAYRPVSQYFGEQRAARLRNNLHRAAEAIASAKAYVVTAGAGMGVDSGLPDFRGDEGLWAGYPVFYERRLRFGDLATPQLFRDDPTLAWGFYGHRLQLYRRTRPHEGFDILRRWMEAVAGQYAVITSNVDGQFQKAGFPADQVAEYFGSIHRLQCSRRCSDALWDVGETQIDVEQATSCARYPLPVCPRCGAVARPNLLMFEDIDWVDAPFSKQLDDYRKWLRRIDRQHLVVIECGAGIVVPWIRRESEWAGGTLIRINPYEFQVPEGGVALACGALEALRAIDEILTSPSR